MHESTVSRVTSNKYLSCARGLFELKYFFSSGIAATDGGGAVSAEAVKSRIRALIEAEDAKAILRSEEHTSELQSLMRISYAVFCLKKKKNKKTMTTYTETKGRQKHRWH